MAVSCTVESFVASTKGRLENNQSPSVITLGVLRLAGEVGGDHSIISESDIFLYLKDTRRLIIRDIINLIKKWKRVSR